MRRHTILSAWQGSRVPERHRRKVEGWKSDGAGPSGSQWLNAQSTIRSLLGTGATVAMIGPRGTGKTQLAVCAVHAVCMSGHIARYIVAFDLFRAINETFGSSEARERDVIDSFALPSLLVIDECHVRRGTAAEEIVLTDLVDKRYCHCRDTILLSNQTETEFLARMGSSVYDRVIETGGVLVCDWPSYRTAPGNDLAGG